MGRCEDCMFYVGGWCGLHKKKVKADDCCNDFVDVAAAAFAMDSVSEVM